MKKIGLICLMLVLALGVLGVGYARWAENLYVSGTVETGDIGAGWSIEYYYDTEEPEKDVSYIDAYAIGDTLYVFVYGGYPCIDYHIGYNIHGTGSIPVHLGSLVLNTQDFPGTVVSNPDPYCYQLHSDGMPFFGELVIHLDNTAEEDHVYGFTATLEYAQYNEP